MAATSYAEIRTRQLSLIRDRVPTLLPEMRFREWGGGDDFDFPAWANAAGEAFRVVEIISNLDYLRAVYFGEAVNDVVHTETVFVAYPRTVEWSGHRLELVIDQDIHDLNSAIGQEADAGYVDGQHNCKLDGATVIDMQTVRISSLIFRLEYHRSVPT